MKQVIFYEMINPFNGKVFYIGKTTMGLVKRLNKHRNSPFGDVGDVVIDILNKGGIPKLNEIHRCGVNDDWQSIERRLILEYKNNGFDLKNMSIGGLGVTGLKRTEKERNIISKRNSRKVFIKNIETGNVLSFNSQKEAAKNIGCSPSAIAMAIKRTGVVMGNLCSTSEYFSQKESSKRYKTPVKSIDEFGKELFFTCANQAGLMLGLDPTLIRKVIKGEYKQYKGYRFTDAYTPLSN